jgi:hypothetical protein
VLLGTYTAPGVGAEDLYEGPLPSTAAIFSAAEAEAKVSWLRCPEDVKGVSGGQLSRAIQHCASYVAWPWDLRAADICAGCTRCIRTRASPSISARLPPAAAQALWSPMDGVLDASVLAGAYLQAAVRARPT